MAIEIHTHAAAAAGRYRIYEKVTSLLRSECLLPTPFMYWN